MGGKKKKQVVGYWYGARAHFGIGLAMDELYQIKVGGTRAWSGSVKQNSNIYINAPGIFGGAKKEGGVAGTLSIMFGKQDQGLNGYLTGVLGNKISAFRGTVTTVFDGWFCANNPYPKPWEFCYRRIKNGWPDDSPWYPEKITINLAEGKIQAMNPAHMLYESYISDIWGSGEARAKMDDSAWRKAADTLFDEKFGLCLEWKATDELKNFRDMICSHIGAKLSTNPTTGLITIRLIRDDYDINSIPIFDEDRGLLELSQDNTNNTEVPSQVIVKYTDAISFEEQSAHATNPAIAQSQGGRSVETSVYQAIPTSDLATRVAYRDLKIKTSALKRFTLKLDRRGADLVIGEPFRIKTLRRKNNFDVIVRAERIEERFLTDGTINVTALQDVFGLPKIAFNPAPIIPIIPRPKPTVVSEKLLIEAPYRELVGLIDEANLQLLTSDSSFFFVLARSPDNGCQSFNLFARPENSRHFIEADDLGVWCPTAKLKNDINYLDRSIILTDCFILEDVEVGTAAIIDDEIVRIDKIDVPNNSITLGRGCADTVPAKHKAGSIVWFYDGYETTDSKEYISGIVVETKLATNTSTEQLELSKAPIDTITMQARQARPYAPGNLKINDQTYPETVKSGKLKLSWSHRNRLIEADQLIDTTLGDITPETNIVYHLTVFFKDVEIVNTNLTTTQYNLVVDSSYKDSTVLQLDNFSDLSGKTWILQGNAVFDTDCKVGSRSLKLNDGWIQTSSAIDDFSYSGDFTLEAWIKPASNSYGVIIDNYNPNNGGASWQVAYEKGKLCFWTTTKGYLYSTKTTPLNTWSHIAVVRKDNIVMLFINGKLDTQYNDDTNYKAADIIALGSQRWNNSSSYNFFGNIDQVRLTKNLARYEQNFIPSIIPYDYEEAENIDDTKGELHIILESIRDGITSYQKHDYRLNYGS